MKHRRLHIVDHLLALVIVWCGVPSRANAQAMPPGNDGQLWFEFALSHDLSKRLEFDFEQHIRFDQDISRLTSIMPDLALSYEFAKNWRAILSYRLQYQRNNNGAMVLRHRPSLGAQYRRDIGDLRLTGRALFQESIRPDANKLLKHSVRTRLSAAWRGHKKLEPSVSAEFFWAMADGDAVHLGKMRVGADLDYEIGAPGDVSLGYRGEFLDEAADTPIVHALLVKYHIEI